MKKIELQVWELAEHLTKEIHGSGIDADWRFRKKTNRNTKISWVLLVNSYHCMNEDGYYDGWQDFFVQIPMNGDVTNFKVVFHGPQDLGQKYDLRTYLEEIFAVAISDWLAGYPGKYTIHAYNQSGRHWTTHCLVPAVQAQILLRNMSPKPEYRIARLEIDYPDS